MLFLPTISVYWIAYKARPDSQSKAEIEFEGLLVHQGWVTNDKAEGSSCLLLWAANSVHDYTPVMRRTSQIIYIFPDGIEDISSFVKPKSSMVGSTDPSKS
ncbi:hypothetical protein OPT61_g6137 [Boeremia exigua]|uniref:Uncharacterized protein n=1 Tax=Boeremia exigua TaxID=749465 RepID=A0ACC2I814_9PLEO|nr:hypothetical protein OPT61_g6137 [Boeremia exigua]